jgi:hypothetical protein
VYDVGEPVDDGCSGGDSVKRSEINALIKGAIKFCRKQHFHLPPFAF